MYVECMYTFPSFCIGIHYLRSGQIRDMAEIYLNVQFWLKVRSGPAVSPIRTHVVREQNNFAEAFNPCTQVRKKIRMLAAYQSFWPKFRSFFRPQWSNCLCNVLLFREATVILTFQTAWVTGVTYTNTSTHRLNYRPGPRNDANTRTA